MGYSGLTTAPHELKELSIVLRALEFIDDKVHGFDFIHIGDQFTQNPDFLE